jgi:raffinose/stachyose/melibiose transport system substrate-binding protein
VVDQPVANRTTEWELSAFSQKLMETLAVLPMPKRDGGGTADCYLGGVSMGFYLTRRAWNSGRRDAAVKLFSELTGEESIRRLGNSALSGKLLDSSEKLREGRSMIGPLQDAMNNQAREVWLLECIPAVAEGTMTPEECWQRVMALNPFGK